MYILREMFWLFVYNSVQWGRYIKGISQFIIKRVLVAAFQSYKTLWSTFKLYIFSYVCILLSYLFEIQFQTCFCYQQCHIIITGSTVSSRSLSLVAASSDSQHAATFSCVVRAALTLSLSLRATDFQALSPCSYSLWPLSGLRVSPAGSTLVLSVCIKRT